MFPMMGSFHGPGGSFGIELLVLYPLHIFNNMKIKRKKAEMIEKDPEENWNSMVNVKEERVLYQALKL